MTRQGREASATAGALAAIAAVAVLIIVPTALARGRVDRSFGTHGRTLSPVPAPVEKQTNGQVKFGMAEGPQGEIYVFDGEVIAAYSARGVPDRHFGEGGYLYLGSEVRYVPLTLGAEARPGFTLAGVAIDSRGRIVVAGTTKVAIPGVNGEGSLATVRRYLPDGKLDPSFGSGGAVTGTLGLPLVLSWHEYSTTFQVQPEMKVTGLAIDSRDRPVLTGSARTVLTSCDLIRILESPAFVARLTPAGALDTRFNGTGSELLIEYAGAAQHPVSESDGGVSATVSSDACRSPHLQLLVRLDEDGSPDPSFDAGGLPWISFGSVAGLAVDRSKRILVLGEPLDEEQFGEGEGPFTKLARVLPRGAADPTFCKHASTELVLPPRGGFSALAVDGRDRPLLAGWAVAAGKHAARFALERMTSSGKLDRSFGRHGLATIGFGRGTDAAADAVLVDRRGRIVLSGIVSNAHGQKGSTSFGLVRYLPPRAPRRSSRRAR